MAGDHKPLKINKLKTKDIIFPVVLLIILLAGIVVCVKAFKKPGPIYKVHQYDYIIEVDGTDSISVYHLFDNNHNEIGSFTGSNCDSLDLLVIEDNL
jgi:hypothetical protein